MLGGFTDDYTAFTGAITLNGAANFTAAGGGRVDFKGPIGGTGSVTIGNATVEGDATAAGIGLAGSGVVVFAASNTYSGPTLVNNGELYVNGSLNATSSVSVVAGAALGGQGTVNASVVVQAGGTIEAGQLGAGTLTLNGGLAFTGGGTIDFGGLTAGGTGPLVIGGTGLSTGGNSIAIDVTGGTYGVGSYPLIHLQHQLARVAQPSKVSLPARGSGVLSVSGDNLTLSVTGASTPISWTDSTNNNIGTRRARTGRSPRVRPIRRQPRSRCGRLRPGHEQHRGHHRAERASALSDVRQLRSTTYTVSGSSRHCRSHAA